MKRFLFGAALLAAFALPASSAKLPGFRVSQIAATTGFANSIAVDSRGIIYYTTTSGGLFRLDTLVQSAQPALLASTKIAQLPTVASGNAGLLGVALFDDNTAAVHYTRTTGYSDEPAYEVISKVDLRSGAETVIGQVADDSSLPGRGVPNEHHGGIPAIGENGSVYVGIGDFAGFSIAAKPEWYGGKILRFDPNGTVTIVASGFRNPYGLARDAANKRLIVVDNGDVEDDEINLVTDAGGFFGWPYTMGRGTPYPGAVPPIYTFPKIVAPTGLEAAGARNSFLPGGYLFTGFVTRALYYVPDVDAQPLPDPIAILTGDTAPLIDVAVGPNGEVYVTTSAAIYRVDFPLRGDCNGDGLIDINDAAALVSELADGDAHRTITAQQGTFAGSWGCDANADGVISAADREALGAMVKGRVRAARK